MKKITSLTLGLLMLVAGFVLAAEAQDAVPRSIKGGIVNGKAINLPKPEYPAEAKAAGLEGLVYVDVEIDVNGSVSSAIAATDARKTRKRGENGETIEVIVPPADPLLREASERAALQAKFSPTQLAGNPVTISGTIVYNFVAKDRDEIDGVRVIEGGVLNGKTSSMPMPIYPDAAAAVRAAGTVSVQVIVDLSGHVISAEAISGHPLLRGSAVKAARQARFSPTTMTGPPVNVRGTLIYNFVPPEAKDDN